MENGAVAKMVTSLIFYYPPLSLVGCVSPYPPNFCADVSIDGFPVSLPLQSVTVFHNVMI